jgi:riboflavin kinase / FMN adenylyltransferase
MQIYHSFAEVQLETPTILTIGKFNGMHLGHRSLLEQVVARAGAIAGVSAALTFDPHPTLVLQPQIERVYLAPDAERQQTIAASGIEHLIVLRYDDALRQQTADVFMNALCDRISLRELWVGPGFRMGYKAQGTVSVLREIGKRLDFEVHTVDPVLVGDEPVSATRIRELLHAGHVDDVVALLGRHFAVVGEVVRGDQRGRTIGFPTANVAVGLHHILPADGVYACRVTLPDGLEHPAVTNVGVRPTFGLLQRTVEAHLLDWDGDLYGQQIRVAFVQRIRGEQKFSGIEELKAQIGRDAQRARELLG